MKYDINVVGQKALDLFNEIQSCTPLDELLDGEVSLWKWEEAANYLPDYIHYGTGATRLVFWDDDCDFVYKVQLYDGYGEEENYEPYKDYGSDEAFAYRAAESVGVAKYFAWTAKVCEWSDHDVYAMEYCDVNEESNSDDSYKLHREQYCEENGWDINNLTEEQEEELEGGYDWWTDTEGMLDLACEEWGNEDYQVVYDVIDRLRIGDLHCGNWGRLNGRLVLTDYAGYMCPLNRSEFEF